MKAFMTPKKEKYFIKSFTKIIFKMMYRKTWKNVQIVSEKLKWKIRYKIRGKETKLGGVGKKKNEGVSKTVQLVMIFNTSMNHLKITKINSHTYEIL